MFHQIERKSVRKKRNRVRSGNGGEWGRRNSKNSQRVAEEKKLKKYIRSSNGWYSKYNDYIVISVLMTSPFLV